MANTKQTLAEEINIKSLHLQQNFDQLHLVTVWERISFRRTILTNFSLYLHCMLLRATFCCVTCGLKKLLQIRKKTWKFTTNHRLSWVGGKYLRPRGPQCIWRASPPALPGSSGQLNLCQHSVSVKQPQSDEKGRQTSGVIQLGID